MDLLNLPPELKEEFLSFLRETNGEFEVADMPGLIRFVAEHGKNYPALFGLLNINEETLVERFNETGEVPPGVKMVRKTPGEGNVTRLEVLHGPIPPKKE